MSQGKTKFAMRPGKPKSHRPKKLKKASKVIKPKSEKSKIQKVIDATLAKKIEGKMIDRVAAKTNTATTNTTTAKPSKK